jgi:hypothetical protein
MADGETYDWSTAPADMRAEVQRIQAANKRDLHRDQAVVRLGHPSHQDELASLTLGDSLIEGVTEPHNLSDLSAFGIGERHRPPASSPSNEPTPKAKSMRIPTANPRRAARSSSVQSHQAK